MTPDHALKFMRAHEHLDTLFTQIQWWSATHPYRVLEERDEQTGDTVISAEPVGQPPLRLSVIAGDVIHNLRSCLDVLTLSLAEANYGKRLPHDDEKLSQFPICDTETRFDEQCKSGRLRYIAADPFAVIKGLQPYHRGNEEAARRDPLAIVRDLSDFDKHRRLPLMAMFASVSSADVAAESWSVENLDLMFGGAMETKTELARYRGLRASSGEEVDMDIRLAMNVAFADGGPQAVAGRPLYTHLSELWRYVAEVVRHLQPYLPDTPDVAFVWPPGFQPINLKIGKSEQS